MNRVRRWLSDHVVPSSGFGAKFVLLAALVPSAFAGVQALRVGAGYAADSAVDERTRARQEVLLAIPRESGVLINIPYADMPASPELVNLGKRSTHALERCLADNVDANARALSAIVLEALGDRRSLPALQGALEDWDAGVRRRVVRALGAMPDKSSVGPLIGLFERKDEEPQIRREIVKALGSITEQRVVAFLRKELKLALLGSSPEKEELRGVLFDALWLNRHLMDRNTLIGDVEQALKSDDPGLRVSAMFAASELRTPKLIPALLPLMESSVPEIANKAIYALGRIGDKTATKALLMRLPMVRESRTLNNLAFALERLDKKAFYAEIAKTIAHKQGLIRLNAAFVLGDVAHEEGLPLLEKALSDENDFVRGGAIVAIGKLALDGTMRASALKMLEPLTTDANLTIREAAIYAMHALTPGGRADLLHDRLFIGLDPRKHSAVIRRAALALGDANDARVRDYLLDCTLSYGCSIERTGRAFIAQPRAADTGRILLGWTRQNYHLTKLVGALKPAGAVPLAMSSLREAWHMPEGTATIESLQLLGGLGDPSAMELVDQRTSTSARWPRIVALVAAGRLGNSTAAARLMTELDDVGQESMPDISRALAAVLEPAFRSALEPSLRERTKSTDPSLALSTGAVLLSWDPYDGFFRFLDGLASTSSFERELAAHYLKKNRDPKVTWALRRALAREQRADVRDRLRTLLDERGT